MKHIINRILIGLFGFYFLTGSGIAEEQDPMTVLKAAVSPKDSQVVVTLEKIADLYIQKKDFEGGVQYFKELSGNKDFDRMPQVPFLMASMRLKQIKEWRATKNWEGLYDKAPVLRKEIEEALKKAEELSTDDALILFRIKYLYWQVVSQEDVDTAAELFNQLIASAQKLEGTAVSLDMIKQAGDEIADLEDKNLSRRFYEAYAAKVAEAKLSPEELKARGDGFLVEKNLYLAKTFFDTYFKTIVDDKELLAKEIIATATKFAHRGYEEGVDPVYAEVLYAKAFDVAGPSVFDSRAQFDRAYNLERMKDYSGAFVQYTNFIGAAAQSDLKAEVYFRLGVLAAYAQANLISAKEYFSKIKEEFSKDALVPAALVQMGLLAQAQKEEAQAQGFYEAAMVAAKEQGLDVEKNELVLFVNERLAEITGKKEMKYGLKLFFDGLLKGAGQTKAGDPEAESLPLSLNVDLTGRPAKPSLNGELKFSVTTSNPQTGCLTPSYSYEWAGFLGGLENIPNSPELITSYKDQGMKVVYVSVIGSLGPEGVGFELVQVVPEEKK